MERSEAMADVHRRFAAAAPELANGFAEHATMGVEAMLALGVDPRAAHTWAGRHDPVALAPGSPVAHLRRAIVEELTDQDWRAVVRRHLDLLTPRLDAHLFHGLIRTAHAVRALSVHDDHAAREELATGLAAWTVWAGDAPHEQPVHRTTDATGDIVELARRAAVAFAARPAIVALHGVTAPMAYLLLTEHLEDTPDALAAAAFSSSHARYAPAPPRPANGPVPPPEALESLARRWDAHPAKLVEAALRGHRRSGDGAFLDAVATMMA